jgi:hypothetical protein
VDDCAAFALAHPISGVVSAPSAVRVKPWWRKSLREAISNVGKNQGAHYNASVWGYAAVLRAAAELF